MGIIRDQKGFTLIEILITIPIIAILAAGILYSLGTSSKILISTETEERAKDLAISDMDYVMSQPYSDQANQDNPASPTQYQLPQPTNYANYVSTLTVTDLTSDPGQEEEIDVAISLNGKILFTLSDYRANY